MTPMILIQFMQSLLPLADDHLPLLPQLAPGLGAHLHQELWTGCHSCCCLPTLQVDHFFPKFRFSPISPLEPSTLGPVPLAGQCLGDEGTAVHCEQHDNL